MTEHFSKRILFDGILLQQFRGGSGAYTYKVFCSLQERIEHDGLSIITYVLYDSQKEFVEDYAINGFLSEKVKLVDVRAHPTIAHIIHEYAIDTLFIGCGQYWIKYNLDGIKCHAVVVIHDVFDCEIKANRLNELVLDNNSSWKQYVYAAGCVLLRMLGIQLYKTFDYSRLIKLYAQDNVESVTVSEYSCSAIRYFFPQMASKPMHILYSPHKVVNWNENIHNETVHKLIHSQKKYYLMVSANRRSKNARFVIDTFLQMKREDMYLVTVGYPCSMGANHIVCSYLSESDLEHLYRHAYALVFPSLEEGFGYPPIEAMRCGIPVLASNVCSMPEICGDAVLYFSPFHHNSLYMQLMRLDDVYEQYVEKSRARYAYIQKRQEADLNKLLDLILQ